MQEELAKVEAELGPLRQRMESERGKVKELSDLKSKLDALRTKLDNAVRSRNMDIAADLRYYAIPQVEESIRQLQHSIDQDRRKEAETGEDITKLAGMWWARCRFPK